MSFQQVLSQWEIHRFRVGRNLGGSSGTNWLVETQRGPHVLRKVMHERGYLDYQLMVIDHLARSGFPYELPQPIKPRGSESYYVAGDGGYWLLYRFIEGEPQLQPPDSRRAKDIGMLVAHFDRVSRTFDAGTLTDDWGCWGPRLLDIEDTADRLSRAARWLSSDRASGTKRVLLEDMEMLLDVYTGVLPSQREAVQGLEEITVYNDWHPRNIVNRSGKIQGLIDFDSVAEAPRIVDFQNALTYTLVGGKATPDRGLVTAFTQGYCSVLRLTDLERSLIYPVMLDRIAWLIANNLDEMREHGTSIREGVTIRLTRLFSWLSARSEPFGRAVGVQ